MSTENWKDTRKVVAADPVWQCARCWEHPTPGCKVCAEHAAGLVAFTGADKAAAKKESRAIWSWIGQIVLGFLVLALVAIFIVAVLSQTPSWKRVYRVTHVHADGTRDVYVTAAGRCPDATNTGTVSFTTNEGRSLRVMGDVLIEEITDER